MWQRLCHGKCLGCRSWRGGSQEEGPSREGTACAEPGGLSRKGRWEGPGHGHGSPARAAEREGRSWWEGSVAEALGTDAGSLWGASPSRSARSGPGELAAPAVRQCRWRGRVGTGPGRAASVLHGSSPRQPGGVTPKQAQLGGAPSSAGCAAGEGHGRGGAGRSAVRPQDVSVSGPSEGIRWKMAWGCWPSPSDHRAGDYPGGITGPPGRTGAGGAGELARASGLWNPAGGWGWDLCF